jgi:hypothetical protein
MTRVRFLLSPVHVDTREWHGGNREADGEDGTPSRVRNLALVLVACSADLSERSDEGPVITKVWRETNTLEMSRRCEFADLVTGSRSFSDRPVIDLAAID